MAYISASDLRAVSGGVAGTLYPKIAIPSETANPLYVSNTQLGNMITEATRIIDRYCSNHFEPLENQTYRLHGTGKTYLDLPLAVRNIDSINVQDYAGTTTAFDNTYWRVHTSLDQSLVSAAANVVHSRTMRDYLELKKPLTVGNAGGNWPLPPYVIVVAGDFGYPSSSVPEAVKRACALIVWEWCTNDMPGNVEAVDSGVVTYRRPPAGDTTGVREADLILQPYRRVEFGAAAVP